MADEVYGPAMPPGFKQQTSYENANSSFLLENDNCVSSERGEERLDSNFSLDKEKAKSTREKECSRPSEKCTRKPGGKKMANALCNEAIPKTAEHWSRSFFKVCEKTENDSKSSTGMGQFLIGPALPPGFGNSNSRDADKEKLTSSLRHRIKETVTRLDDVGKQSLLPAIYDEKDEVMTIGPALPPEFHLKSATGDLTKIGLAPEPNIKKFIGPALPPGFENNCSEGGKERYVDSASNGSDTADSSLDYDVIGPLPLPSYVSSGDRFYGSAAADFERRAQRMKEKLEGKTESVAAKRESWMTELPPEMGPRFGLVARQFRSGNYSECGDRSVWTDTPSDRAKKEKEGYSQKKIKKERVLSERDKMCAQKVSAYNKQKRPESLLEMHTKEMKKKKMEEPRECAKRQPFDRERDLQTVNLDASQKQSIINRSQGLNTRFGHGKTQFL